MYTVSEITRMRAAVARIMKTRLLPGAVYMHDETHFTTNEEMEIRLNTYILAGIRPYQLESEADRIDEEWDEKCKAYKARHKDSVA